MKLRHLNGKLQYTFTRSQLIDLVKNKTGRNLLPSRAFSHVPLIVSAAECKFWVSSLSKDILESNPQWDYDYKNNLTV